MPGWVEVALCSTLQLHRLRGQSSTGNAPPVGGKARALGFRNTPREKNTKAEAKRLGRQIVNELEAGSYVEPSDLLLRDYLDSWLEDVARHRVATRTRDRYRIICRHHLVPALGNVKLASLRPDQVQRLYGQLSAAGSAPATVQKVHAVLHSALKHGGVPTAVTPEQNSEVTAQAQLLQHVRGSASPDQRAAAYAAHPADRRYAEAVPRDRAGQGVATGRVWVEGARSGTACRRK